MRKLITRKLALCLGGTVLFMAGCLVGRQMATTQKTLLHVFAYTPRDGATQKEYADFKKATADMVGKVPGLKRAWVGQLREPIPAENDRIRTFGAAMEFESADALDAYASLPVHKEWEKVYEKVRAPGTTTLNILGE